MGEKFLLRFPAGTFNRSQAGCISDCWNRGAIDDNASALTLALVRVK